MLRYLLFSILLGRNSAEQNLDAYCYQEKPKPFCVDLRFVDSICFWKFRTATRECHSKIGHQTNIIQMAWIVLCIIILPLSLAILNSGFGCLFSSEHGFIFVLSLYDSHDFLAFGHFYRRSASIIWTTNVVFRLAALLITDADSKHPLLFMSEYQQYQVCYNSDGFLVREYTWKRTCFKFAKWASVCVCVCRPTKNYTPNNNNNNSNHNKKKLK